MGLEYFLLLLSSVCLFFMFTLSSLGLWKRKAAAGPARRNNLSDSKETKRRLFPVSAKRLKSDQEVTF